VNKREPDARGPRPPGRALAACVTDEEGAIRGGNAAFEALFGVALATIAGTAATALMPSGLRLDEVAPQEVIGRHADGTPLALIVHVTDVSLPGSAAQRILTVRELGTPATVPTRRQGARDRPTVPRLLEGIGDHLYAFRIHRDGRLETTFSGPGGERIIGAALSPDIDAASAWSRVLHPEDRTAFRIHLQRLVNGEETDDTMRFVGLDGITRWIALRAWPYRTAAGVDVFGIAADVTGKMSLERVLKATIGVAQRSADASEEARAEADRQARTDALTGISNRRHLGEQLRRTLASATEPLPGLVLLDVDHFKRINDAYGHAAGDMVLVEIARRAAAAVRATDCVARWGGEEFCVLLREIDSATTLRAVAESIRLAIERTPIAVEGIELSVTVSVGAALAAETLNDPDDLVDAADRALYTAKRRGRNQTRLYDEWEFEDFIAEDPEAVRIAEALALAASLREGPAAKHPHRVAELAMRTAETLGSPPPVVLRCRLGGWLHDVGKVAIPDRILTKPGALEADEWVIMRGHPAIGEEVVRRVAGLKEAARAVRHHHERWDGTGYPDALAGEAIPIEARVVAAADAYVAMTSERPHRAALPEAAALAELAAASGTQLDPTVVRALLHVLEGERARRLARENGTGAARRRGDRADDAAA
jgi:diguanylate cyclase (GGDEF)-like protein